MSAIAQILCLHGYKVHGSDRNYDYNKNQEIFGKLISQGIQLFTQDGSGVDEHVDEVIVSTAIEDSNPDVLRALRLGIPIVKRAEMLSRLFNKTYGIAVGGTSGKSTVTAMIGHILTCCGKYPTIVNGGLMTNFVSSNRVGNAVVGNGDLYVIEADESDGTIQYYSPHLAVVTNISKDHKPLEELYELFGNFLKKSKIAGIVSIDCNTALTCDLHYKNIVTFGLERSDADFSAHSIQLNFEGVKFVIDGVNFTVKQQGQHSILNSLAAIAACQSIGISLTDASNALGQFLGVGRRLQKIGELNGITVIDDFAHNPDKITATLSTVKRLGRRLLVMFQPHGFAPTRFNKDGLIKAFTEELDSNDLLAMPEIFYAGGTAKKTISSVDLIDPIVISGINARYIPIRSHIADWFTESAKPGDIIVIMGARDNTLSDFAKEILIQLQGRK